MQRSLPIKAPATGNIIELPEGMDTRLLREGDVICVVEPKAGTRANAKPEQVPGSDEYKQETLAAKSFDSRDPVHILAALFVASSYPLRISRVIDKLLSQSRSAMIAG